MVKIVEKSKTKIILNWVLFSFLIFFSLGAFTGGFLLGLLSLILPLLVFPSFNNFIEKKFNIKIKWWIKFIVIFVIMIFIMIFIYNNF